MTTLKIEDFLEHFGVKGMKWGVIKENRLAKKDAKWEKKTITLPALIALYTSASKQANRDLKGINKRYVGKDLVNDTRAIDAYHKEITDNFNMHYRDAARQMRKSPTGRKEIDANIDAVAVNFVLKSVDVAHADTLATQGQAIEIRVRFDADGFVTEIMDPEPELAQSSTDTVDDFLEHFGVKGMKWGVRKDSPTSRPTAKTRYKAAPKHLTDAQLQERIKRMETEKRYNDLNKRTVGTGEKIASDIITSVGKNSMTMIGTAAVVYGMKQAIKKKFGTTTHDTMFPKKK